MTRRTGLAIACILLAVPAGLWVYNETACACLTPDQAVHLFLRTDIRRVVDLQQALWATEHRYARSLADLRYTPDPAVRLALTAVTDSSFRIDGESVRWPGVTCQLDVGPHVSGVTGLRCTGRAPGPLGW